MARPKRDAMTTAEITTLLGPGSAFEGKLTFEGTVRIEGQFAGEIATQGTLIVGASAEVKAEIRASHVVVEGTVRGDIVAGTAVEIRSPARVYGNIATPSLEIEKGSLFQGNCTMEATTATEDEAEQTPAESEPEEA